MSDKLSGAKLVLKALKDNGVDTVFGYPGGAVLPLYDEIFKQNDIKHVLVRQEGGAVHAAEAYARSTGKVGVVLVTSGPGATNAVTGLTDALLDSIPVVCITGQVPTLLIGNDAFQEADTTGITRPASKHNYLIKNANDISKTVHDAFYVATTGRPGPVVIDLPKDVQNNIGDYQPPKNSHRSYKPKIKADISKIEEAVEMLARAKRPVFYCGGGIINSDCFNGGDKKAQRKASELLTKFVKMTGFPITLTLMGLGAYPATDKQFLGMLGMHGTYQANNAMHDCDVMCCIGARFDDRVTAKLEKFSPMSEKIHIDIDPSSINKNVAVDLSIVGDAGFVLEEMIRIWEEKKLKICKKSLSKWNEQIQEWKDKDCLAYVQKDDVIKPQYAIERLYKLTRGKDPFITTEVGQHQMWAAQLFKFDKPLRWLTSGGLGTMGYGLPAAVGTQVANPKSLVCCIAGESSLMMNIQEFTTAVHYKLPIKVMVLNNNYMGMVRQWQELMFDERYSETYHHALPDLVKLAEAFGGKGLRVEDPKELDGKIQEMLDSKEPVILDVRTYAGENCYPMVPPGAGHNEMWLNPETSVKKIDKGVA